jgi:hypothetical protein
MQFDPSVLLFGLENFPEKLLRRNYAQWLRVGPDRGDLHAALATARVRFRLSARPKLNYTEFSANLFGAELREPIRTAELN